MNVTRDFQNLRFDRRNRRFPRRLIPIVLGITIFILLWNLVPSSTLFWLLMPLTAILTWIASYGWRPALTQLINFLHRLEQF